NRTQWLTPLVWAMALPAVVAFGLAVWQAVPGWQPGWQPALLVIFVAVVQSVRIPTRVRATAFSVVPGSVATILCVIYARPSAAVVYVSAGTVTAAWLLKRLPAIKVVFNAAKETLAVAAAVAAAHGC